MTLFKSKIKGGKYNDNSTSWIRCGRCTRSTEYNTDTRNFVNVLFQKTQMKGGKTMFTAYLIWCAVGLTIEAGIVIYLEA